MSKIAAKLEIYFQYMRNHDQVGNIIPIFIKIR